MQEDETIHDYYMNVLDIANSFDSLGEKLSVEKLVREILRSLPKRFDMTVKAIEEAQDISSMQVDELIGSLQNFELVVDNRTKKKGKGIALTSNTAADEALEESVEDENLSENLVMLGRQFNRILKQVNRRSKGNGQNIRFNTDKQQSNPRNDRIDEKNSRYKGVQCHECEGYGHIGTKCATFLKKQKKGMIVSWYDNEEADGDVESDTAKRVTAMTRRVESESGDEDPYYEKVTVPYIYKEINDIDTSKLLIEQEEIINHLQEERIGHLAKISELNKEVMLLNSQLDNVLKQVRMMTTRSDVLDRMLEGQVKGKPNGISFTHEHLKQEHQNSSYV